MNENVINEKNNQHYLYASSLLVDRFTWMNKMLINILSWMICTVEQKKMNEILVESIGYYEYFKYLGNKLIPIVKKPLANLLALLQSILGHPEL